VILLAGLVIAALAWKPLRPLRNFFAILLAIYAAEELLTWATSSSLWLGRFGQGSFSSGSFTAGMLGTQLRRLGVSLLMIAATFFGIGHFYGVPYGVIGVVMATFLGWLLSKAMIERRGFFWAWFIHFLQDVLIFSFMAIGSITPGG
jgi:hypothetical protein